MLNFKRVAFVAAASLMVVQAVISETTRFSPIDASPSATADPQLLASEAPSAVSSTAPVDEGVPTDPADVAANVAIPAAPQIIAATPDNTPPLVAADPLASVEPAHSSALAPAPLAAVEPVDSSAMAPAPPVITSEPLTTPSLALANGQSNSTGKPKVVNGIISVPSIFTVPIVHTQDGTFINAAIAKLAGAPQSPLVAAKHVAKPVVANMPTVVKLPAVSSIKVPVFAKAPATTTAKLAVKPNVRVAVTAKATAKAGSGAIPGPISLMDALNAGVTRAMKNSAKMLHTAATVPPGPVQPIAAAPPAADYKSAEDDSQNDVRVTTTSNYKARLGHLSQQMGMAVERNWISPDVAGQFKAQHNDLVNMESSLRSDGFTKRECNQLERSINQFSYELSESMNGRTIGSKEKKDVL